MWITKVLFFNENHDWHATLSNAVIGNLSWCSKHAGKAFTLTL